MQFEEEEGTVAVPTATDDDNEVRQTSCFEVEEFRKPESMSAQGAGTKA